MRKDIYLMCLELAIIYNIVLLCILNKYDEILNFEFSLLLVYGLVSLPFILIIIINAILDNKKNKERIL